MSLKKDNVPENAHEPKRQLSRVFQIGGGGLVAALIAYEGKRRIEQYLRDRTQEVQAFEDELQATINEALLTNSLRRVKVPFDFGNYPLNLAVAISLRDNNPLRRINLEVGLEALGIKGSAHPLRNFEESNEGKMLYVRRIARDGIFGRGTKFDVVGSNNLYSAPIYPTKANRAP